MSSPEAFWRLSEYSLHFQSHTIKRLPVHLPHHQCVTFREGEEEEALARAAQDGTALTAYFILNQDNEAARQLLYYEVPEHFILKKNVWVARQRGSEKVISRIYYVSPKDAERFYLRTLLLHVRGSQSYEQLRTVDEVVHETFRSACIALHLLEDDQLWAATMREASNMQMPREMRLLFVTILTNNAPSDPLSLWNSFKADMQEDFALTSDMPENLTLLDIQQLLLRSG